MATPTSPLAANTNASREAKAVDSIANEEDYQSSLVSLSDLGRSEARLAMTAFDKLAEPARTRVALRLIDATENSVEFNFKRLFRAMLDDSFAEVRRLAILGLWEDDTPGLNDRFIALLEADTDPDVRAGAAVALQDWCAELTANQSEHVEASARMAELLVRLVNDPKESPIVRRRALETLGALNAEEATDDALTIAYVDDDQTMAAGALRGMGLSGSSKWEKHVEESLNSEDAELRYEAAGAAGLLGNVDFVPSLAALMEDDDTEVQQAAAIALGRIGGDAAQKVLTAHLDIVESPEVVVAALEEAKLLDDPLTDSL